MYAIVTVSGLKESIREMQVLLGAMRTMQEINQRVGEHVLDLFTNDVYESEGKAIGHGWQELSMPYAYQKYKKYGAQLTLVATGRMRASNVLYTTTDLITIKNTATNDKGEFYAAKHQYGDGRMPARVLMDLTDEEEMKIEDQIIEWINGKVNNAA